MNASTIKMPNHRRALHGARRVHITETPRNIFPAGIAVYNIRTDQIEDRREAEHTCPPESITALASSINKYGVIHPLSVKVSGEERYVLVSGSRRLRAARLLGLCEVPCIVITADDARSVGMSISENVHTHTMHYIDVALAIEEMRCRLALSVEGVAAALCLSLKYTHDKLRLLEYSCEERKKIKQSDAQERTVLSLLDIDDAHLRARILAELCSGAITEDTAAGLVRAHKKKRDKKALEKKTTYLIRDVRIFYNSIERALEVMRRAGHNIRAEKTDSEECTTLTIRIPK